MTKRLSKAAAVIVLAVPIVASCGFSQPTDQDYNPGVGVHDRSGTIDVLNALIVTGSDGSGTIIAALVNNDQENDDRLAGITGSGDDQNLTIRAKRQVDIPAAGAHQLADKGEITAKGDQIVPGHFVTLTFTFQRAEDVTVDVPVVKNTNEFAAVPVP